MIFTETALKGAYIIDLEPTSDSSGILRARLLPEGVRGARIETRDRPGQRRVQSPERHVAGNALSVSSGGRDQSRAMHTRRDPRHHRRSSSGKPHLSPAHCRRADRGQSSRAVSCRSALHTDTRCSRTRPKPATRWASSIRPARKAGCCTAIPAWACSGRCR